MFHSLMNLGALDWLLVILFALFLYAISYYFFIAKKNILEERLKDMQIFAEGTAREKKLQKPFQQRVQEMVEERVSRTLKKTAEQGKLAPLQQKFILAGTPDVTPSQFYAKKVILTAILFFAAMFTGSIQLTFLFAFGGFYLPTSQLNDKIKKRQLKIRSELPDFLDLLASTAVASKNLEDAIRQVCLRSSGILTEEFVIALDQINAGRRKRDALNALAERCGVEELNQLISQINQAETFGTPVENTLISQADRIRLIKKDLAETRARKASVTLILPSFFLLVTALIIIAGPSVVSIFDAQNAF